MAIIIIVKDKPCEDMEKDHFTVGREISTAHVENHREAQHNFVNKIILPYKLNSILKG